MNPPVKLNWLDRAVEIRKWHIQQCKDDPKWTLEKTASALGRSLGSVSQDILIASFIKTHEKQLRRCDSMREALRFVRSKQREMELSI